MKNCINKYNLKHKEHSGLGIDFCGIRGWTICLCARTKNLTEVSQGKRLWFQLTVPGEAWRQEQKLPVYVGPMFRKQKTMKDCFLLFYFTAEPQPKEWNYTQLEQNFTIHRHAQIFVSMVSLNFIKIAMKMNCHWDQTPSGRKTRVDSPFYWLYWPPGKSEKKSINSNNRLPPLLQAQINLRRSKASVI